MTNDAQRLTCYDAEIDRAEQAFGLTDEQRKKLAAKQLGRAQAASAGTAQNASKNVTGNASARNPEVLGSTSGAVPSPPSSMQSSKIAAVTRRPDGRNVITLDNGQVWLQGEAFDSTALRAGDAVTIKPGLLGSLYMVLPSNSRTRVTRQE